MKPQDPQLKLIFTWDINKIQRDNNRIIALYFRVISKQIKNSKKFNNKTL